ncbi:hypothetical protein FBUS_03144 [Fasciolopsis buskii]|uniref:Uncharacterized protein n=1 Tax=Fasciolopsis buskii TaxID=27845 RepID=A0A8E0VKI3_9TREM|nr:hypothetical protein FBUS_03144 [Fasciolopsis buski]
MSLVDKGPIVDPKEHINRSSFVIQNEANETLSQLTTDSSKNLPLTNDQPIEVGSKTSVRLIWKAFVQTPVRLTEADTWPISKPEQYGSIAMEKASSYTMNQTIRGYRHMLPHMIEVPEVKNFLGSLSTPRITTTRQLFNSPRGKAPRFLKTLPPKHPKFPLLKRSSQFEDFLTVFQNSAPVGRDSVLSKYVDELPTAVATGSEECDGSDNYTQSDESVLEHETYGKPYENIERRKFSSLSSSESRRTHRKKYPGKSKSSSLVSKKRLKFCPTAFRSLAALESLKQQRAQLGITEMALGGSSYLNIRAFNDTESVMETLRKSQIKLFHIQSSSGQISQTGGLGIDVIDLKDKITSFEILDAKIRDHDLNLPVNSDNVEKLRKLYQVTIMREPMLRMLFTTLRPDSLPPDLQRLVRMASLYRQLPGFERPTDEQDVSTSSFDLELPKDDAIAVNDPEHLWMEAGVLIVGLFVQWMKKVQPNQLIHFLNANEVETVLRDFGKKLQETYQVPTSTTRQDLQEAIAACAEQTGLVPVLLRTTEDWLDNLLGCLSSSERTVREQTCYVLAYLFTNSTLVTFIRNYATYDIPYDVTVAVLHAMELHQASFLHYYCLLAFMIEGCPIFSILNAVIEIGPRSPNVLLNHMWPRLIYYALKYWNTKQFLRDRGQLKILNECIERAYLRGISRKNAKLAQIQLSRRFKIITKPTTVWLDEWKKFDS